MFRSSPASTALTINNQHGSGTLPTGHVLINGADEIIYANRQARHFLGLLADESLPKEQTFLSMVQTAYQCFPFFAWLGWPKQPSAATTRYLVFRSANNHSFSLLKVEIIEQITLDNKDIWVVAIDLVETPPETAVLRSAHC